MARTGDGNVPADVRFDVFDSDFEWEVGRRETRELRADNGDDFRARE